MDINDLRSITTVVMLAVFAAIVWWAYSGRHKATMEEAGRLPLDDDDSCHSVAVQPGAGQVDK